MNRCGGLKQGRLLNSSHMYVTKEIKQNFAFSDAITGIELGVLLIKYLNVILTQLLNM